MASCIVLLFRFIFVSFIVDAAVKSSEPADIRADVELAKETSNSSDRKYQIDIQFYSQQGKSVIQSARKLFKYLKNWKKSYKAEVELAECFAAHLGEKFLRLDLNSCTENDEYEKSRIYLSKMRSEKQDEYYERLKQESNFNRGNWMHVSDIEEAIQWALHPWESNHIAVWEEEEIKHLFDVLRTKITNCEFKRAIAQLLLNIYMYVTTFFSKNLLLVCIIKYFLKKFWKWIDLAP